MRSTITLNGKNSSEIEGLLIQSLPPISKPLMRTQIEEIDGRDGDIVTNLGFSAYSKQITIGLYGNFDINEVIEYFTSKGTVIFSNEPDKYYYYQITDQIDFERLIRFRTATVTMHCQPFKYSTEEGTEVFDSGSNLLTIPNSTTTKNGITVKVANNILTISGKGTAATEFYIPIDSLSLSVGKYGLYALGSGTSPESCSVRVIYDSPSAANSFGGTYVTLKNNQTVSIITELSNAKTYNYIYLYIAANTAMNFTLNLSIEDAASSFASDEGSLITLENTALAPFTKFDLKGDTDQISYSGKNLYEGSPEFSGTWNNENNWTTSSETYNGMVVKQKTTAWQGLSKDIQVEAGKTYTFSCWVKGESGKRVVMYALGGGTTATISPIQAELSVNQTWTRYSHTFTVSASGIVRPRIENGVEVTTPTQICGYQLEESNAMTDFEPYVGGTASPNPDYPQEVQTVTGRQVVTISDGDNQSQEYEVNLGKNLFSWVDKVSYGLTSTYDSTTGLVHILGTASETWSDISGAFTTKLPAGTYTFSLTETATATGFNDISLKLTGTSQQTVAIYGNANKITFTTTEEKTSLRIVIGTTKNQQYDTTLGFQIEKGSSATSYAPYFTPIELCKIGTYQDKIYKSGDDWYIHKAIEKATLNGTENWQASSAATGYTRAFLSMDGANASNEGYCDELTSRGSKAHGEYEYVWFQPNGNPVYIQILTSRIPSSTIANFKSWLGDHPATIYRALATPTDTQITDENLIEQLDELWYNSHAYKGTTNLASTSEDLPHIMSVAVAKNNDATITNSGNTTAKPVMTIYGEGNIGVYLNGNQIFTIALGTDQYITLDIANMEAYKDTTDNLKNRLVDGDYSNFVLQQGDNSISFSGTVTKFEISNYSRWI